MSRGNLLLELQIADDHVATLRRHVAAMEATLAGDPELDTQRIELQRAHDAHVRAQTDIRAAELEMGAVKSQADALNKKLYGGSVRKPAELLTLQHELDGMKERLSPLEDAVLERMEDADARAEEERTIGLTVAEFERKRSAAAGPDTDRLDELRGQLDAATRERDAVLATVAPADVALYERLARRLGAAVVHIAKDSCGGCRMPLGIQEARSARSGETLVQCANCDRILVS